MKRKPKRNDASCPEMGFAQERTKMKKKAFLLLLPLALLAACSPNSSSSMAPNSNAPSNPAEETNRNSNLFAFEAATSIGLASLFSEGVSKMTSATPQALSTDLKQTIIDYLPSIEATLKGEEILTENLVQESDREEYQIKLVVQYKDINLDNRQFIMYYNETPVRDEDWRVDWDDHYDDEEECRIEGILVLEDQEFEIRGEKEKENDELEVSFWYYLDTDTYVQVSQERERGESQFEYEVYNNRKKIHAYSLEQENGEVELELLDGINHEYTEMSFVDFEKDGKYYILAKLDRERIYFEKKADGSYAEARIA